MADHRLQRGPAKGGGRPIATLMWYVYILRSFRDGKFYVGSTSDLKERVRRHNAGRNVSTRHRIPFELVYSEVYDKKEDAVRREYQVKRYKGGEAFKKLISH